MLWFAFLFVAMVLCGTIWVIVNVALWLLGVASLLNKRGGRPLASRRPAGYPQLSAPQGPFVRSTRPVPDRPAAEASAAFDMWPKWTASYRRYVAQEKLLWQEQFDSLDTQE
ncbi:hypothetical protein [Arthrobacter sp. 9AX]|uniref:hypothetical protein n=1 Tax=Arthrobacter sp. 9AX TaxID=2653131 RepID=UPI001F2885F8|nr:hypothetical protein [Arthrobacter sp. 9AX]